MNSFNVELAEIRKLKAEGNQAAIRAKLQDLLSDHLKLLDHLRELRRASAAINLSAQQNKETQEMVDGVECAMAFVQSAIDILMERAK